jgi:hypothetical protein
LLLSQGVHSTTAARASGKVALGSNLWTGRHIRREEGIEKTSLLGATRIYGARATKRID